MNGNPNRIHLVGHSSGAHICALALIEGCCTSRHHDVVNGYVGLSGVFSIPDHFEWEKQRGVEELSPMAPANRRRSQSEFPNEISPSLTPIEMFQTDRVLLLHGSKDNVVPFRSTTRFRDSKLLKRVKHVRCRIVPNAGHVDPIMSVMRRRGEFWMRLCCFVKGEDASDNISVKEEEINRRWWWYDGGGGKRYFVVGLMLLIVYCLRRRRM